MAASNHDAAAKRDWVARVLRVTFLQGGTASQPSLVQLQTSRLAWDAARKAIKGELAKLEQAILDAAREDENFGGIQTGVKRLGRVLETLDERLSDSLDAMLNADPAERPKLSVEARAVLSDYNRFVAGDPLMIEIDANPFLPVSVQSTAVKVLQNIDGQLARYG